MKRLYDCDTAVRRLVWIKSRLLAGGSISEISLKISGVANPSVLIEGLRATGMQIETIRGNTIDANGNLHKNVLAWRMLEK